VELEQQLIHRGVAQQVLVRTQVEPFTTVVAVVDTLHTTHQVLQLILRQVV
jgi:hypothetical protein